VTATSYAAAVEQYHAAAFRYRSNVAGYKRRKKPPRVMPADHPAAVALAAAMAEVIRWHTLEASNQE
jgi:hypothetical protein